jgi:hypothetical protein
MWWEPGEGKFRVRVPEVTCGTVVVEGDGLIRDTYQVWWDLEYNDGKYGSVRYQAQLSRLLIIVQHGFLTVIESDLQSLGSREISRSGTMKEITNGSSSVGARTGGRQI